MRRIDERVVKAWEEHLSLKGLTCIYVCYESVIRKWLVEIK
jgi:hypothetical protein